MTSAPQTAIVGKTYIASSIKLDFSNDSNLKFDIQKRVSNTIETDFNRALKSIRGDRRTGVNFSEIVRLAMAYFYSEIFKNKIKDSYYTLEMVKGFLDGNNLTDYTAIHEIDVKYYNLYEATLFKHCWLIIQTAWYFNSKYFGHHQHIDYLNHYMATGEKLPIEHYRFDSNYLEKKYIDIDNAKVNKIPINGFSLVNKWYYGILFLVCKELELPTIHFIVSHLDNREFNPITKSSRQLRCLAPFKIIECDIKSAFPTFLDIETSAKLKDHVYNNLMLSKGITRGAAKILFNTVCNSGKYKSKEETIDFLLACGYNLRQCEQIIKLTHDPYRKFYSFMTEYENDAIAHFVVNNDLKRSARLHDAVLYIDNKIKPKLLKVDPNCDFGYKELNKGVHRETFSLSDKRVPYAYFGSIPQGLNLIKLYEGRKSEIKGVANGFVFYKEPYNYVTAVFNINDYTADYKTVLLRIQTMLNTLEFLNGKKTKPDDIYMILQHIRANSQYIFNVKAMYLRGVKYKFMPCLVTIKERSYGVVESMLFKSKFDFMLARNEAEKGMNTANNYYELFCLMEERIANNDYGYINEAIIKGKRKNNVLIYAIIMKFNFLCTGLQRLKRKQDKNDPLYGSIIKGVTLKAISLKPQQQNAFVQKCVKKYERELKEYNRLVNNRKIAQQLFLILCERAGQTHDFIEEQNIEVQNQLKTEIMAKIDKADIFDFESGAKEFDKRFKTNCKKGIPAISDLENIFDTDMDNCVFNQVSIEEAHSKGVIFFDEFIEFHGEEKLVVEKKLLRKPKEIYRFPELDF